MLFFLKLADKLQLTDEEKEYFELLEYLIAVA